MKKPIVGQPIANNREDIYHFEGIADQFNHGDPQDLAERIVELISDPQEMARLQAVNERTFEKHLAPQAVVRKMMGYLNSTRT